MVKVAYGNGGPINRHEDVIGESSQPGYDLASRGRGFLQGGGRLRDLVEKRTNHNRPLGAGKEAYNER